jgi:hypothetical protein
MQINQTENELTLRETPGCLWIFGLFFAIVGGVFVYGALGGFVDSARHELWMLAAAFVMGSIGVGVGAWIIYRAPVTKIIINRIAGEVFLTRYGLFGRRQTFYHFDEIEQFSLIEDEDDEGNPIFSLGMNLINGDRIQISALPSHDERFKREFVFQTNEFMRKQIASTQMILELEDDPRETPDQISIDANDWQK